MKKDFFEIRAKSPRVYQFHCGLDPQNDLHALDWRGEVRGRRGGSADPLRRGPVEHDLVVCGGMMTDDIDADIAKS